MAVRVYSNQENGGASCQDLMSVLLLVTLLEEMYIIRRLQSVSK